MENIIINDLRIQILDNNLVRIEKKYNGTFEDNNTFFIPNRSNYFGCEYKIIKEENYTIISFGEYNLFVPNNKQYSKIYIKNKDGAIIYKFKKIENSGELPRPYNTPDVFALNDAPHIIMPVEGYTIKSFKNKKAYKVLENKLDLYLFLINKDYRLLRKMFIELTGRVDLVRMQTLGLWNSRYYKYRDEDVYNLINEYKEHNIPLDNFVIDTDWRKANDIGIGYEIDTVLFPNMKNVFDFAHERNISIMFNDHPEPFEKVCNVFDYKEVKFREYNLTKLLELGLDTWWYDRNWSTKLISPTKRIEPETMGLYLFSNVTKNHYKNRDGKYYTRPDIMGNVNNILHGDYLGINDSASHRYSIQWTGDITHDESSISREVRNLILGSENEITYINFDVGGHVGNPDKELYLKWMKFASFTPIMRPHCTNYVTRFREPWNYDEETLNICREYINMKYRLLAYVYSYAYKNYLDGEPLIKSLSYLYPNNKKVRNILDTYIIGNNILVSPEGGEISKLVDKKYYTKSVKAKYFDGIDLKGKLLKEKEYKEINMLLNRTQVEKEVPVYNFSAIFETSLKFDQDVILKVKNDDGVRVYINGELMLEDWKPHGVVENYIGKLKANEEYDVKIEYYQGGGEAALQLSYIVCKDNTKTIFLPNDKWVDVFNGKVCKGNKKYVYNSLIHTLPVFIKEGSLIPLLKTKNNTAELRYDDLIFNYYPSKDINDNGFIYEDDRKTIAYQDGINRLTNYRTYYDSNDNSCNIIISPSIGNFEDDIRDRKILFKYHLLNGCNKVTKVLINGEEIEFKIKNKNSKLYPFNEKESSPTSKVLVFDYKLNINKENNIKFILE